MTEASRWRNHLLSSLSSADRNLLLPHLEMVDLEVGETVEAQGEQISHLLFVERGVLSIIGRAAGHSLEVGMIGREGMTGSRAVLSEETAANQVLVQTAGRALRIAAPALREMARARHSLASTLLNYVHTLMAQANQAALASGRARLDERLARWLLMWQDRVWYGEVAVTHEFLASLLGVRRQAVTKTLHELEGNGLIRSLRGRIGITDRAGLLDLAGGFYGVAESEYERLIGVSVGCLPRFATGGPQPDWAQPRVVAGSPASHGPSAGCRPKR